MTTKKFNAEIGKVLHMMVNSIYTNKDIFLRELISNASDACDKMRYHLLQESIASPEFAIQIAIDKANNTISILDNGIGMDKEELDKNLGTIAYSGTERFLEQANAKNSQIGQFGVGFYSAFMVADKVEVISKKANQDKPYKWISDGKSEYEIIEASEKIETSGTKIILHMKPEASEYLEEYKIKHIVKLYSDNIAFAVYLLKENGEKEKINTALAIWLRPKNEVTSEQYDEFYHQLCHMLGSPWQHLHFTVEGKNNFTALLYIPNNKPYDLFNPDRATRTKLYVRKVFITDSANILPAYLRFVKGVIDSEDLPLNISRETLQNNYLILQIKRNIVKRLLKTLKDIALNDKEKYMLFWQNFGEVMKEGLCEGALEEKEELLEVCRFKSTKSSNNLISLEEYVSGMKEDQEAVYYFNCEENSSIENSAQLEGFLKRDIEVILLSDQVDDFWVNVIHQYKDKPITSVSTSGISLNKEEDTQSDAHQGLIEFCKKTLGSKVKEVILSNKLEESPACISTPPGSMNAKMEKMLIEQRQLGGYSAKNLEINPKHPLIKYIDSNCQNNSKEAEKMLHIVFAQALMAEGQELDDPFSYVKNINSMLEKLVVA